MTAGCPGTQVSASNARSLTSVLEATGSDPPGRVPAPGLRTGSYPKEAPASRAARAIIPQTRPSRHALPATAPHPGFSRGCDHPPGDQAYDMGEASTPVMELGGLSGLHRKFVGVMV